MFLWAGSPSDVRGETGRAAEASSVDILGPETPPQEASPGVITPRPCAHGRQGGRGTSSDHLGGLRARGHHARVLELRHLEEGQGREQGPDERQD